MIVALISLIKALAAWLEIRSQLEPFRELQKLLDRRRETEIELATAGPSTGDARLLFLEATIADLDRGIRFLDPKGICSSEGNADSGRDVAGGHASGHEGLPPEPPVVTPFDPTKPIKKAEKA